MQASRCLTQICFCAIFPSMRTTIEIPDMMFREVKSLAARSGKSLRSFVVRAIEKEVARTRQAAKPRYQVKLPLLKSKHPGKIKSMTNAEIEDLLD
jgi:hypothetical protein